MKDRVNFNKPAKLNRLVQLIKCHLVKPRLKN